MARFDFGYEGGVGSNAMVAPNQGTDLDGHRSRYSPGEEFGSQEWHCHNTVANVAVEIRLTLKSGAGLAEIMQR
jgi:hypothetical protein